uniref:Zinc-alpha-2-glycoprotein n=1 Tax=Oryctolagus cuniculus TaxID=9986 RepID=A0A5F9CGS8_RABIT
MVPVLLSLPLLLGSTVPQGTQAGPYLLTFLYTGLSRPSKGFPRFQATAFLNDQVEGMEDWKKESQLQQAREEIFLETLKDAMNYYKESTGSHTFQGMFGCELQNNRSSGAFWRYAYDGEDFIEFNKEVPAWVALDPAALNTKKKWEAEKVYVQRAKAYLEEECPGMLQRYLNYSRTHLDRQEPPSVTASSHMAPGQNRTLKCLAYDFYPQGIGLHWTRAGEMQKLELERHILPSGKGTYLSWVVVGVPSQDRAPYSCHVEHRSLAQPLTLLWDERQTASAEDKVETPRPQ